MPRQTSGYNKKQQVKLYTPVLTLQSALFAHSDEISVPVFSIYPSLEEEESMAEVVEHDVDAEDDDDTGECSNTGPQCFNREELNDLVRDLALSKELPELVASRLKEKNYLRRERK